MISKAESLRRCLTRFTSLRSFIIKFSICHPFTASLMTKTFTTSSILSLQSPNPLIFNLPMTLLQSSCLRWSLFRREFLGKRTITLTKTNIFNSCRLTTPKTKKSLTIKKPFWPFSTILSEKNPNPKSPMKHPKMPSAISLKIYFPEKETNKSFFPLKINSAVLLK